MAPAPRACAYAAHLGAPTFTATEARVAAAAACWSALPPPAAEAPRFGSERRRAASASAPHLAAALRAPRAQLAACSAQEPRAVWKGFVTGSLAAVAAGCVTHPIDLVKVRMQLAGAAGEAARGPAPGLLATAAAVVRADGVRGLYSGISGSVLRQTTTIGARLGFYDAIKNRVAPPDGSPLPMLTLVACGLAAGAASAALCNPAELVLVRMQADGRLPVAQQRGYAHAGEALVRISREEGVAALWRGTAPTVARAMVVTAAQMSFYDRAKAALLGFLPDAPATHGLASLVAGGAAAVSSNPFDVVKTRLQNMAPRADGTMPYRGFVDCFVTTARTEGFRALYKGLVATWARQAPLNTVRFIALEQLRKIIG